MSAIRFTDFVNCDDIRMAKCRRRFSFADKTIHSISIVGEFLWQNLERDLAVELRVMGQIYLTHSTDAELRHDAIMRKSCRGFQFFHQVWIVLSKNAEAFRYREASSGRMPARRSPSTRSQWSQSSGGLI